MKELLLILLMPIIGFGQTAEEYFEKAYNHLLHQTNQYLEPEEYQLAIADFTKAIRIDPGYVNAYYYRGLAYHFLKNYEDAIADYTRAIRIDPDYVKAYNNRGLAYEELGNYEDAIADFTRAIRIDPDDANAYKNRGIAKEEAGLPYCSDFKKACNLGLCDNYNDLCK